MSNPITTRRRRRFAPLALGAGILSVVGIAVGAAPAVSGFTAAINNTNNTVASGTLLMTETQAATTCLSSAAGTVTASNTGTCASINKFGGATSAVPGTVYLSSVTIVNNGTIPANTFTLTPLGCAQSANGATNGVATDLCGKVNITISDDTNNKCVYPSSASACAAPSSANTLTTLGTAAISLATPMAPGASRNYTFKVQIDGAAGNNYQGLTAAEQLNWAFAS